MNETLIKFENYTFQYRSQSEPTLHDINLSIQKGERVIIVGASGCGKSTLAHCLNGLNPFCYAGKHTGSLQICGVEAAKASIFELSKYVGTVLQDTDGQFIGMTVLEDIAFALENECVPNAELEERTRKEAEMLNLTEFLDHAPHDLSGGQKQRVSMAGVLVTKTPILLFDEPLANLDPAAGKKAIELIDQIQKDTDTTVVIIEHRLEDALHMGADRIILMEEGKVKCDMAPSELFVSDALIEAGIREPLFVTALKYAAVPLNKEMHLGRIQDLQMEESQKQAVLNWFEASKMELREGAKNPIIEVSNLSFGYGDEKKNLTDINFTIHEGEMVSIVGKNGAGKSTLAKLLCGFQHPQSGTIAYRGRDLAEDTIKERAKFIGYVMQNPNQMISKAMIFDEVAMSLQNQGLSKEEVEEKVFETLKICGLYQYRKWPIQALSYGQKKRVTIASILVQNPEILILDEPTAGQDFRHYTEIMEFLKGLNQSGVTVIMITHDMHLMLEYTNRTIVFSDGRLIADTTPVDLFSDLALVERASLKETSLFGLASMCGIDPKAFIDRFITQDRKERQV
ncbi:duplicated ATPase component MtsB of energizing module of methionine-regulated ECF transporter [Lachnospiraceae bacterium KM106-2]|nr:duplicated ATPase component MtsB of energizing module of methionine-regulated ECF transporter [Lachnospiraceae bacterium KM106-2]